MTAGRKPKDQSQIIRARTWYYFVKSREGLSDQKLSEKFVTDHNGNKREGAGHIRYFGRVRIRGVVPSQSHPLRLYDLVGKIDKSPNYQGSANLLYSPFWELIGKTEFQLEEIRDTVIRCAIKLGLFEHQGSQNIPERSYFEELEAADPDMPISEYLNILRDGDPVYDEILGDLLAKFPYSLDVVAFVAALGYEAKLANKLKLASDHVKSALILLEGFCRQDWVKTVSTELYELAEQRMNAVLKADLIENIESYSSRIQQLHKDANSKSDVVAFLTRHEHLVWNR